MKKKVLIIFAIAAIFTSCEKKNDVFQKANKTITASLELNDNDNAKTMLDEGNVVLWSDGDALSVFDSDGVNYKFRLSFGAGTKSGVFVGEDCSPVCALSPYSEQASVTGTMVTFELPSAQNYVAGSFGNNANVAIALYDENGLSFKNVCGVLCIQIKGNYRVSRIVLTGNSPTDYLCGTFKADASLAEPVITYDSNGSTSVTLNCGSVQLSPTVATPFYIVVPAETLASGFTATIYDDVDDIRNSIIETSKPQLIKRNVIRKMEEQIVSHLKNVTGVKELTCLKGAASGQVAIDSKIVPDSGTKVITRGDIQNNITIFGSWVGTRHFLRLGGATTTTHFVETVCLGDSYVSLTKYQPYYFGLNTFELSSAGLYINGKAYCTSFVAKGTCTMTMGIMGSNNGTYIYDSMRSNDAMTYLQVWQNNILTKYFIPCITTEVMNNVEGVSMPVGTIGMYEVVGGALYTSSTVSTGAFTYESILE